MTRVLYEKHGKRYKPVSEYDPIVFDAMEMGAHLVIVKPGIKSTRYHVEPENVRVLATIELHREAIMQAMRDATEVRPYGELSLLERKAYKAYCDVMGREAMLMLSVPAASSILDALEKSILDLT